MEQAFADSGWRWRSIPHRRSGMEHLERLAGR
jgi:hypothetical protein